MINLRLPTIATPRIATPRVAAPGIRLPGAFTPPATAIGPVIPPGFKPPTTQYAPLTNTVQIPNFAPNIKLPPVVDFSKLTPGWGPGAMTAPQFAAPPPLTGMMALINTWNTPSRTTTTQTATTPKLPAVTVKPTTITTRTK